MLKFKVSNSWIYNIILNIIILLLIYILSGSKTFSAPRYLNFAITVIGKIDRSGNGLYFILLNKDQKELINVADNRTYTDFICFNGINAIWYHRRTDPINPSFFIWEQAGIINTSFYITPDASKLILRFNIEDKSIFLNQYITQDNFNAHIVATDNTSRLKIDTLGQGPDIINNSINTILVNKQSGSLPPYPAFYPVDPALDIEKFEKLGKDFPYENFDILKLEIFSN